MNPQLFPERESPRLPRCVRGGRIRHLVALLVLALALASCTDGSKTESANQSALKVGAIFPLTGNLAFLGQPERTALQLAAREINAGNGRPVELFLEDSRGEARDAVAAARKLIDVNRVDLAIVSTSAMANAVAPVFQEARIPLITLSSDATIPQRYSNAINFYVNVNNEQQTMARHLLENGISSISSIRVNAQITELGVALLKRHSGNRLNVVNDLTYELGTNDFRSLVARAKSDSSQAIYLMGYGVEFPALVRALREQDVRKPIFGNYTFLSDAARVEGTQVYDGIHFTAFTVTPEQISGTEFGRAFAAQSGGTLGPFMDYLFVYEALTKWHAAVESGVEPRTFPQYVRGRAFNTLFGAVTIDSTGNALVPMAVATYGDGGRVRRLGSRGTAAATPE